MSALSVLSAGTGWGLSALAEVRRSVRLPDGWWVVVALSALAAVRLPVLFACLPAVVAAWPRVWPAVSAVCALSRTCTLSAPLFRLLCLFCLRCVFLFCLPWLPCLPCTVRLVRLVWPVWPVWSACSLVCLSACPCVWPRLFVLVALLALSAPATPALSVRSALSLLGAKHAQSARWIKGTPHPDITGL